MDMIFILQFLAFCIAAPIMYKLCDFMLDSATNILQKPKKTPLEAFIEKKVSEKASNPGTHKNGNRISEDYIPEVRGSIAPKLIISRKCEMCGNTFEMGEQHFCDSLN